MNRRGFLLGCIAACTAPAIVRAESLMRIAPLGSDTLSLARLEALGRAMELAYQGELCVSVWGAAPAPEGFVIEATRLQDDGKLVTERYEAPIGQKVVVPAGRRIIRVIHSAAHANLSARLG